MKTHTVSSTGGPQPLGRYLARAYPALPGWVLRDALKKRDVRVNGQRCGSDALVRQGDEIKLYIPDKYFGDALRILYEDGDLLVVEKPAGLPVDRDGREVGEDTVLHRLQSSHPDVRLCHRLDTWTGGVLITAKHAPAEARVRQAMSAHRIDKRYLCVVVGAPPRPAGTVTAWLLKDAVHASVRACDAPAPGALPAETAYRALTGADGLTLMDIHLITGRTHQIRVHMAHIGCPVLGDDKYGDRDANRRLRVQKPQLWCREMTLDGLTFRSDAPFVARWFPEYQHIIPNTQ